MKDDFVHPYIPNSVKRVKQEMLEFIGAESADELYSEMIPDRLRLKKPMELPNPILSEFDLKKHMLETLDKNVTTDDYISFLGAGCWRHYIPKICEVISNRSEFLTAYAGGFHSDLGRYQALFEFQSLICELLELEVSGIPTYDWGAAAGNSIRMASRLSDRKEVIIPKNISPGRLKIIKNFCEGVVESSRINIQLLDFHIDTGKVDLGVLEDQISENTACVYFENPNYLGVIESNGAAISKLAHEYGAESIVGVDPISLGIISPPADYGVDIVCGEAQPLGIHMNAGGGSCGFIASYDKEKYVAEYPLRLISITDTETPGEYGFGEALYERTSYIARENAKDWIGTTTTLWGITAAVYLSLIGPRGIRELGETIIQKSHYTAKIIEEKPNVVIPYKDFFKEFPVRFESKKVNKINNALLEHKIIGGKDISSEFPELGEIALFCITEMHSIEDISSLDAALKEVLV
jgi:glycine dehydrogenase subunit 1